MSIYSILVDILKGREIGQISTPKDLKDLQWCDFKGESNQISRNYIL